MGSSSAVTLPFTTVLEDKEVIVDIVPNSSLPNVYKFFCEYAATTISVDEFLDEQDFVAKSSARDNFGIHEKISGRLIVWMQLYPSPVCRSLSPVFHAGYTVIASDYRGNFSQVGAYLALQAFRHGYHGMMARACVISPAAFQGILKYGGLLLGCIPMSSNIKNTGWVDDVILYQSYSSLQNILPMTEERLPIKCDHPQADTIPPHWASQIERSTRLPDTGIVHVQVASDADRLTVEHMIYDAAMRGSGFALDEFNTNGTYSRKMFKASSTIVVKDSSNSCIGAVICGQTSFCRSQTAPVLGFHVVLRDSSVHSLGELLFNIAIEVAKHHGYSKILTDVYVCDQDIVALAYKCGFVTTASIPKSGYIKNYGYCDANLMVYCINSFQLFSNM